MPPAFRTRSAANYLLRNPNGPVGKHLKLLASQVAEEAERLAQKRLKPRNPAKPRKKDDKPYRGNFKAKPIRQTPRGPAIRVSNDSPHATAVERDTKAHFIFPNEAPRLKFFWEKKKPKPGWWVGNIHRPYVKHPGTKGKRILEDALDHVIKRPR